MNMDGNGPILGDLSEFAKIQLLAGKIRRFREGGTQYVKLQEGLSPIFSRSP
jgi:hypothetical protein